MMKKTIIVTGANSGIGFEAAKELCRTGHDVVVTVRDDEKGNATTSAIKQEVPDAEVTYLTMELSEPVSIKRFVENFHNTGKSLHVLLNNAGVSPSFQEPNKLDARGNPDLERAMTVNCMGTFLLTNLLLDELKSTGTKECPSRIVNVTSSIVCQLKPEWRFDIDNIMLTKPESYKSGAQAYRCSKVALNLWSNELAKRLKHANVIVNTVSPGFIPSTNLTRHVPDSMAKSILLTVFDSFVGRYFLNSRPKSVGMERLVKLAVDDNYATSGIFYKDDKPCDEPPEVADPANQEKIWDACLKYSE